MQKGSTSRRATPRVLPFARTPLPAQSQKSSGARRRAADFVRARPLAGAIARQPRPRNAKIRKPSDRVGPAIAGADPHRLLDRSDEDLAVADAPGARRVGDRLDDIVDQPVV